VSWRHGYGHRLIIFGFVPQSSKTKAVAVDASMGQARGLCGEGRSAGLDDLAGFRYAFYECLTARSDALFELADAVLCTEGPVRLLVGLSLAPEHRRGHGALYDAVNHGVSTSPGSGSRWRVGCPRAPPMSVGAGGGREPVVAAGRGHLPGSLVCHTYGRGKDSAAMIPGWPYSFVAAWETGRSSWTAVRDAIRLEPGADMAAVTTKSDPRCRVTPHRGCPVVQG
jgi:hypothetical protein